MLEKVSSIPEGYHSVNVYIAVKNAREAILFYQQAFSAIEKLRFEFPDGRILFAELQIGNSTLQISDEFPEREVAIASPQSLNGTCCAIHLYVDDADRVFSSAIQAGGTVKRSLENTFWGDRYGQVQDPYGHIWSIATRVAHLQPEELKKSVSALIAQSQG